MAKYTTYAEKLKDPRWQKKRLEIMERDNFQCKYCYSKEKTLHVHHRHYRKGAMPWDYENHLLVTLCDECHREAEDLKSFLCERMGSNKTHDLALARVCAAIAPQPEDLTHFGWAAESLALAISEAIDVENLYDEDQQEASIAFASVKSHIAETIENLHRALFHYQERFRGL